MTTSKKCIRCNKPYAPDGTPMAHLGWCMECRRFVDVQCDRCSKDCKGAPDGQMRCRMCRHKEYMKEYVWRDPTGGRLTRLRASGSDPMKDEHYKY